MFELSMTYASTTFDTTEANSILSTAVGDIGTVLVSSLPLIFGLVASLVGVFFIWRLVQKKIGGTKG